VVLVSAWPEPWPWPGVAAVSRLVGALPRPRGAGPARLRGGPRHPTSSSRSPWRPRSALGCASSCSSFRSDHARADPGLEQRVASTTWPPGVPARSSCCSGASQRPAGLRSRSGPDGSSPPPGLRFPTSSRRTAGPDAVCLLHATASRSPAVDPVRPSAGPTAPCPPAGPFRRRSGPNGDREPPDGQCAGSMRLRSPSLSPRTRSYAPGRRAAPCLPYAWDVPVARVDSAAESGEALCNSRQRWLRASRACGSCPRVLVWRLADRLSPAPKTTKSPRA